MFDFKGEILAEAVERKFENRNMPVNVNAATFDSSSSKNGDKNAQWQGFIKKVKLIKAPESFEEVIAAVKFFLKPLAASIIKRRVFNRNWTAPSPWR